MREQIGGDRRRVSHDYYSHVERDGLAGVSDCEIAPNSIDVERRNAFVAGVHAHPRVDWRLQADGGKLMQLGKPIGVPAKKIVETVARRPSFLDAT